MLEVVFFLSAMGSALGFGASVTRAGLVRPEGPTKPKGRKDRSSSSSNPKTYYSYLNDVRLMESVIDSQLRRLAAFQTDNDGWALPDARFILECQHTLDEAYVLIGRASAMDTVGLKELTRQLGAAVAAGTQNVGTSTQLNVSASSNARTHEWVGKAAAATAVNEPSPPTVTTCPDDASAQPEPTPSRNVSSSDSPSSVSSDAGPSSPMPSTPASPGAAAAASPQPTAQTMKKPETPRGETPHPESPVPATEPAPTPARTRPSPATTSTDASSPSASFSSVTPLSACTACDDTTSSPASTPCSSEKDVLSSPASPVRPAQTTAAPATAVPAQPSGLSSGAAAFQPAAKPAPAAVPAAPKALNASAVAYNPAPKLNPTATDYKPKSKLTATASSFTLKEAQGPVPVPAVAAAPSNVVKVHYPALQWAADAWNASVGSYDASDNALLGDAFSTWHSCYLAFVYLATLAAAGRSLPRAAVVEAATRGITAVAVASRLLRRLRSPEITHPATIADAARAAILGNFLYRLINQTMGLVYCPLNAAGALLPRDVPEVQALLAAVEAWAAEACPTGGVVAVPGCAWFARGLDGPGAAAQVAAMRAAGGRCPDPHNPTGVILLPEQVQEQQQEERGAQGPAARSPLRSMENLRPLEVGGATGRKGVPSNQGSATCVNEIGARFAAGRGIRRLAR